MTPITTATNCLTPRQYLLLVDRRLVGDWALDGKSRATFRAMVDGTHPAGIVVAAKLLQAYGDVLSVAQVGGRYAPDDLAALTGAGLATLQGLVANRCNWLMATRRNSLADPKKVPGAAEMMDAFKAIRLGEAVFGLDGPINAAQMEASELYSDDQIGGRVVTGAARFFGNRGGVR